MGFLLSSHFEDCAAFRGGYSSADWVSAVKRMTWKFRHVKGHAAVRLANDLARGFAAEENVVGDAGELARVRLAPQFRGYSKESLLVLETFVCLKKARALGTGEVGLDLA